MLGLEEDLHSALAESPARLLCQGVFFSSNAFFTVSGLEEGAVLQPASHGALAEEHQHGSCGRGVFIWANPQAKQLSPLWML